MDYPLTLELSKCKSPIFLNVDAVQSPKLKTTEHPFVHSELANHIWAYPSILQTPTHNLTIEGLFAAWLSNHSMYTMSGFVAVAYFLIGLREIWFHRNSIIHEESKIPPKCSNPLSNTSPISSTPTPPNLPLLQSHNTFRLLSILVTLPNPPQPTRTLNGSLLLGASNSILMALWRTPQLLEEALSETCKMVLAYSSNFGPGSNIEAETQALLAGLQICRNNHITLTQIEVDSLILQKIITQAHCSPWNLIYWIRQIKNLLPNNLPILHTLRSGNSVADALAKSAHDTHQDNIFTHIFQLPSPAQHALLMDSLGHGFSRL